MDLRKLEFFLPGTNGKGVMLIHGLTGAPAEMRPVAKKLNKLGYTVYAPLLAGHGEDEKALIRTRWQDWLESLQPALEYLKRETDDVFTAGICVGGKLGMMLAQKNPGQISAASVFSPAFRFDGGQVPAYYIWLSYLIPIWGAYLPGIRNISFPETGAIGIKNERMRRWMAAQSTEGVLEAFPIVALAEMFRLNNALRNSLPKMKTPCLILHAREDDLAHPRNAEYINRHYGGPHELHFLEDSYHLIHVDHEHGKVVDLCDQFFSRYAILAADKTSASLGTRDGFDPLIY